MSKAYEKINWKKIDIITYSGEYMSEGCKAEVEKAVNQMMDCENKGDRKRAAYIRGRLDDKRNYVAQ